MSEVSIIMPIYNIEKYLRICIESIIGQSYKLIDIILVDAPKTVNIKRLPADIGKTESEKLDSVTPKKKSSNVYHN